MNVKLNSNCYIMAFWVGLMDADGSIQVNHWRKRSLQYRLVIKLKNSPENVQMLFKIKEIIGGTVRVNRDFVIWVENYKKGIQRLLKIFEFYPPLTSRLYCQLNFLLQCWQIPQSDRLAFYFEQRPFKYEKYPHAIGSIEQIVQLPYFSGWISGFIEGEGCFSSRVAAQKFSFSIGQKNDKFLLDAICYYFGGTNKVRVLANSFFVWEVYKKEVLRSLYAHFLKYPLLGFKKIQKDLFYDKFLNFVEKK